LLPIQNQVSTLGGLPVRFQEQPAHPVIQKHPRQQFDNGGTSLALCFHLGSIFRKHPAQETDEREVQRQSDMRRKVDVCVYLLTRPPKWLFDDDYQLWLDANPAKSVLKKSQSLV
jgi:hypothetical protein